MSQTSKQPSEPFYQPIRDLYLPDRVSYNVDVLHRARIAIALFLGTAAGILGLTGVWGFVFFLLVELAGDFFLLKFSCGDSAERFLPQPNRDFFTFGSLTTGLLTAVFAWLVSYNVLLVF